MQLMWVSFQHRASRADRPPPPPRAVWAPLAQELRAAILQGDMDTALSLFEMFVADDADVACDTLRFELERQAFVERVRRGRTEDALALARNTLSAHAAVASASAYNDFKQSLVLLALGPAADRVSSLSVEWSVA